MTERSLAPAGSLFISNWKYFCIIVSSKSASEFRLKLSRLVSGGVTEQIEQAALRTRLR